ncbi:MAG: cytochrome c [Rhodobacteraceae bacterium]|nr:cytochrome c [Paracoccaceae bacterium]
MSRVRLIAMALACLGTPGTTAEFAPADAERLERLVLQDCGSCHGLTRKGGLGPDIRAASLKHWDAADLTDVILDGIPGTAMPPWRPLLSMAEAAWIADYLKQTE